jgi:DNA repair exonuclease SbcCD ATPase subunit
MENERVVKFFIGTLLDQTIESVEAKPQEFTYTDELVGVAVFRLDFIALIKTAEGERKKVLVEVQKAQKQIDLIRFRSYIGEQYKKQDMVDGKKTSLPIVTIYILGFTLPVIDSACMMVGRFYKDLITRDIINQKDYFVELLSHDCFIVQAPRITDRYQTRLDKLLSVFEQTHFIDDNRIVKEYEHVPDDEEVKLMTDILHHSGAEPKERKLIEIEQEAWRTINAAFAEKEEEYIQKIAKQASELAKKKKEVKEKDKEVKDKAKALEEQTKALEEQTKAIEEQAKALAEQAKEIEALKRRLNIK